MALRRSDDRVTNQLPQTYHIMHALLIHLT